MACSGVLIRTRWSSDSADLVYLTNHGMGSDVGSRLLRIQVLGLASIDQDVTPELARAAIAALAVLGALHASPAVKIALADRIR
jgi:hypothetical protein